MGLAHERGRAGEEAALRYFDTKGYSLLARNFRVRSIRPLSEIDLIFLAVKREASAELRQSFAQVNNDVPDILYEFVVKQFSYLDIVFVEVKSWKAYPLTDLCYNLSPDRQQRMFCTAQCFLEQHPQYVQLSRRFDLVIFQDGAVRHIEAAFP